MSNFINKIKSFFDNVFNNKKALPETSLIENDVKQFNSTLSDMVNSTKIDDEKLIEMIKNRELRLEEKSSDEIKEIQIQLDKYLKDIQKNNLNKVDTINLYKSKLTTN